MTTFNLKFIRETPSRKLNFIGATIKYFDAINSEFLETTQQAYIEFYNNNIFPLVNISKSIDSYTVENVEELLQIIEKQNMYSKSTMQSTIRHLVYDPIKYWFKEFMPENDEFSITPSDFRLKETDSFEEAAELKIIKSLTVKEEKKAFKILLSDPQTDCGEYVGLAIMLLTAVRNNEACGFNFGDLIEMIDYPECYYLQVTKTTEIDSNQLKGGGKTYNAFRRIPVVNILKEFILNRMEYLNSVLTFPYEYRDVVYKSVYELPIVCRENRYGARANARDLTRVGRDLLRNKLNMSKSEIAGVEALIFADRDSDYDLGEKDATTYLLRRNMATHLYTLGFSTVESQYFMGHKMENTALKRSDFGDELFLHNLWGKLQKHPLNNQSNLVEKTMDGEKLKVENESELHIRIPMDVIQDCIIKIKNKELNDSVRIELKGDYFGANVIENFIDRDDSEEINIIKAIHRSYK